MNAESCVPSWEAASSFGPLVGARAARSTHADTLNDAVVFTTGPPVVIAPLDPLNDAAPDAQLAPPLSVPALFCPDQSRAVDGVVAPAVPSFSFHQPVGAPVV